MPAVLELSGVSKDFRGLRPLRVERLWVEAGERVAIVGFDRIAAEVFVNLVTGATLPDAGSIAAFGTATRDIADAAGWLAAVDRFGIVSERAVLLESLTVLQNLALPFSLEIDPLPDDLRRRAEALALEIDLDAQLWDAAVSSAPAAAKMRIRLGRALALEPQVLLLEHVSAGSSSREAEGLAETLRRIAAARRLALVAATVDEAFARRVASRVLRWEPASGRLVEKRSWLGGRLG